MEEKNVFAALSDEEMEQVDGGLLSVMNSRQIVGRSLPFDPDYCPKTANHKHFLQMIAGVTACYYCGGQPR